MPNISEGKFKTNINYAIEFLKTLDIVKDVNRKNTNLTDFKTKFSKEFLDNVYSSDYKNIYDIALQNLDYDILLLDESFFQFSFLKKGGRLILKYSYYPNPYQIESYEKFCERMKDETYRQEFNDDNFIYELYEQLKIEADLRKEIIPFRYDYDDDSYEELIHPLSHIHIGIYNEIRIPVNYILLPDLFVLYIIILVYLDDWQRVTKNPDLLNRCLLRKIKSIECITENVLNDNEKKIVYIN